MIKILNCHIDNYGCYKDVDFSFENNLTVIKKDNGQGKTTLKNFIIDLLFSEFNSDYKPGGTNQKGNLTIEIEDKTYKVYGDNGLTKKNQFKIYDESGNILPINSIGFDLFNMNKDAFKRIFSISKLLNNDELFTNLTNNSTSRNISLSITNLLAGGTTDSNVGTYKENLQKYINKLSRESDNLDDEIFNQNRNIIIINQDQIKQIETEIVDCQTKIKDLFVQKEQYDKSSGAMDASIEESNNLNTQKENILSKYNNNLIPQAEFEKYNNLKQYTSNNPRHHSFNIVLLIVGLIILGIGIVVSILSSNVVPACLGLSTSVIVVSRVLRTSKTIEEKEIIDIKSKYNYDLDSDELKKDLEELNRLELIMESHQINSCTLSSDSYQSDEFESITDEINHYRNLEIILNNNLNDTKKAYNEQIQKLENLNQLKEQKSQIDEKYNFYNDILETIKKAEENIKNKFGSPIKIAFEKYINSLQVNSLKELQNVTLNKENFKITFNTNNGLNEFKSLSDGQKAILEIAAKFAVSDCLSNIKNGPIIMDDPMANLDESAISSVSDVLKELSKDRQIIYFTCHSSRIIK